MAKFLCPKHPGLILYRSKVRFKGGVLKTNDKGVVEAVRAVADKYGIQEEKERKPQKGAE